MKFEFEEGSSPQFLVGISQFYEYGPTGEIETALFTFYPFTEIPGHKGLKATALKVGAAASYGQVTPDGELRMFNPEGDRVKGEIRLHGNGPWPVEFRILGEDESTHGHPPVAKQIPESEPTKPGWGGDASEYEGEWELTNGAEDPTAKAGTLGAVIGVAQGLGVNGAVVSGGSMTVSGNPAIAEVKVQTGASERTFTLTDLAWEGDKRTAQVHNEGAESPPVGRFEGTGGDGEVKGRLISGHSVYQVEFKLKDERPSGGRVARRSPGVAGSVGRMDLFARSLATLIESWAYLASGSPGAEVRAIEGGDDRDLRPQARPRLPTTTRCWSGDPPI